MLRWMASNTNWFRKTHWPECSRLKVHSTKLHEALAATSPAPRTVSPSARGSATAGRAPRGGGIIPTTTERTGCVAACNGSTPRRPGYRPTPCAASTGRLRETQWACKWLSRLRKPAKSSMGGRETQCLRNRLIHGEFRFEFPREGRRRAGDHQRGGAARTTSDRCDTDACEPCAALREDSLPPPEQASGKPGSAQSANPHFTSGGSFLTSRGGSILPSAEPGRQGFCYPHMSRIGSNGRRFPGVETYTGDGP